MSAVAVPTCKSLLHPLFRAACLLAALACGPAFAAESVRGLSVDVVGTGRPVLMIPGVASAGEVWTGTCAALQPEYQCHIVQLPGFAGQPAVASERYLEDMRDRLLAYAQERKLERPVVIGHSLGGTLALMLAAQSPLFERVVVVDSLPFLAAIRDPGATPETARQMAAAMRKQAPQAMDEAYIRRGAGYVTRDAAGVDRIVAWTRASDPATSTQAMSELWGADLRPLLPEIEQSVLVLGAWAAYAPMGSTLESVRSTFETQYAGLKNARVEMSRQGYHFLMWDDAEWLDGQVRAFLDGQ